MRSRLPLILAAGISVECRPLRRTAFNAIALSDQER